ncbi:MAG TPA: ABC transporter permease [Thermoanaerobaculia bacterium]|nr:ABC transporter permease [Thermoanaerobaculia bacterium]
MSRLSWLLRRELWESRSLYLAPLGVAALVLLGSLVGAFQLPAKVRATAALAAAERHEALVQPYLMVSLLLMATTFVVAIFYSLDALLGERRDRSILLWKSLPVSDLATVLAKASVPIVLLPLLTVALTFITHLAMFGLGTAALAASGEGVGTLWAHVDLTAITLAALYHMVAIHALWHAPIYAWLLLASAWSRRAPWLWASLPLAAIAIVEHFAFGTSAVPELLARRMGEGVEGADIIATMPSMDPLMHVAAGRFLSGPGLWLGLAAAALFLAGAVRLRRVRGPV